MTVFVFVSTCLAVQCGALRFSPLRHSALWLLSGSFASLLFLVLAALCDEASRAVARIFVRETFRHLGLVLSALAVSAGAAIPFAFSPPGEPIFGAADQGIYLSSGIHLARTGSYRIEVPILGKTPSALQPWVLGYEPAEAQRRTGSARRFWNYQAGFVLDPQPENRPANLDKPLSSAAMLSPQFPPGFPLLLAAAYDVGGWKGLSLVNRALTILAAALLGLLANRWLQPRGVIGVCVFLLAVIHPLNLWTARSFFAEPSAHCFWLLAMVAWAQRRVVGEVSAGLLVGATLAGGLYLKFDMLPVGSLTGMGMLFTSGFRFKFVFLAASAAVGLSAFLAWWQFCWPNFSGNITSLWQSRILWYLVPAGLLAGGWQWWRMSLRSSDSSGPVRFAPEFQRALRLGSPLVLAGMILTVAAYAYWIRPNPAETRADRFFFWPINALLRSYREETFFRLGWYWQPLGLATAVIGLALLVFRLRSPWQKTFFWVGLISLLTLSYDLRNNPLQPYAMRRLIPTALPCLILGAAASLPVCSEALLRWHQRPGWNYVGQKLTASVALLGTTLLLFGFLRVNSALNTEPKDGNFAGLPAQTSGLAQRLPARSILLIRGNAPFAALATPLQIIDGVDTILIRPASHSQAYQDAFLRTWRNWTREGYHVMSLSPIADDRLDLFGARFMPAAQGKFSFPMVQQSPIRLNTNPSQVEWDYFLGEIRFPNLETSSRTGEK